MASNRMSRFEIFIGTWNTTGMVLTTKMTPATIVSATDTFRWLPGRYFIAHDVDARLGTAPTRFMEVIGYDLDSKKYVARSYDDQGSSGVSELTLRGRKVSIVSDGGRFNGKFDRSGNTLEGTWERSDKKAGWQPWISLRLVRA